MDVTATFYQKYNGNKIKCDILPKTQWKPSQNWDEKLPYDHLADMNSAKMPFRRFITVYYCIYVQ